MLNRQLLLEIELSAANLYVRLAARASYEGKTALAARLSRMACEERAQAQRIEGVKTGNFKGADQWSHYRLLSGSQWQRGSSLGSRESRVARYLGLDPLHQPWEVILPKLGSAELLIAFYYLVFKQDYKTFKEEITHAKFNGVTFIYVAKGLLCLF